MSTSNLDFLVSNLQSSHQHQSILRPDKKLQSGQSLSCGSHHSTMRKLHQRDPSHEKIEFSRETLLLQGAVRKEEKKKEKSIARILPHKPPQSCLVLRCQAPTILIGSFSHLWKTKRSAPAITLGRIWFVFECLLHDREIRLVMKRSLSRGTVREEDVIGCLQIDYTVVNGGGEVTVVYSFCLVFDC